MLETTNPAVAIPFRNGLDTYVVRRTDKYWVGLGCDIVIEQTLMRILKSNGGLTRGNGMDYVVACIFPVNPSKAGLH